MSDMINLNRMGKMAREASLTFNKAVTAQKNNALGFLAKHLLKSKEEILKANAEDLSEAKAAGLDEAMLDRLNLNGRIEGIVKDIEKLILLEDPIGKIIETKTLENGLKLTKRRTPIGVLGVIYESRPNVTVDVAALAIKTGNCAILRGGSETLHTNLALIAVIQQALADADLPIEGIQFIKSNDRAFVNKLLKLHSFVDLIIPRGGAGLHQFCRSHSKIPVITGGIGICHLFVDKSADLKKTLDVLNNAKTQRPTVCNALDTTLVHSEIAQKFVPEIVSRLGSSVKFRLDPKAMEHIKHSSLESHLLACCEAAEKKDWDTERLSLILGIKVVADINQAILHVQKHSSGHSDGILTEDGEHAKRFIEEIDSACVYVNASTRFTDGAEFGLGMEVAISTQKLHARGPMGLEELTSYKWIVEGHYQIRK